MLLVCWGLIFIANDFPFTNLLQFSWSVCIYNNSLPGNPHKLNYGDLFYVNIRIQNNLSVFVLPSRGNELWQFAT